ncbi:hypothetical protein MRX96_056691, partial [Rhipicephalus microplus]
METGHCWLTPDRLRLGCTRSVRFAPVETRGPQLEDVLHPEDEVRAGHENIRNPPTKSLRQYDTGSGPTVLDAVRRHDDAWLFSMSLDETMCPGYFSIVKEPMDLTMITERVEKGAYSCKEAFVADFKRMVENCAFYNGLESVESRDVPPRCGRRVLTSLERLRSWSRESAQSERQREPFGQAQDGEDSECKQEGDTKEEQPFPEFRRACPGGDDGDNEDFAEPRVKRKRGRPSKATRTQSWRRPTSKATSRTRPVVKNAALEALSRATRKALE